MTIDPLLARLEKNVKKSPTKEALTFLGSGSNGGVVESKFTYKEIWDETDNLAENLLESGMKQGDMAVLVYPPSLDFVIAFVACLKAGIVAVPVFPPHPTRKDTLLMFSTITASCDAKYALTNTSYNNAKNASALKDTFLSLGRSTSPWPENLTWIVTDKLSSSPVTKKKSSPPLSTINPQPTDLAFLQYTSGSTSEPKGVMISHNNLADNLTKITNELKANDQTIVASWLPQYHDMGLIGSYLGILYCGGSGFYMSPLTFLQRPVMWIEAISRFHATHIQAPNFAFKLTSRKFNASKYSKASLDLSSLKHIINAAEPVTEESINAFNKAFVPFGLKKEVMFPTYGLAEHTVFVCSGGKQKLSVSKRALEVDGVVIEVDKNGSENTPSIDDSAVSRMIGCGYPSEQNVDVKIVSTETLEMLGEDKVGEIWILSDSKAQGYYKKPEISKSEFYAEIGGGTGGSDPSKGYLRTGDLGFMHNNELFVCGRLKDLIIIGGRNYYPQDIEATVESANPMIRPGCSAAFTIDPISGGDERVAVVLELRETPPAEDRETICDKMVDVLRGKITQEHSLSVSNIVLLVPKTVPKTSSGKISRARCRKGFLENSLKVIYAKAYQTQQSSMEVEQFQSSAVGADGPPQIQTKKVDPESIRSMSKKQIEKKLLKDIGKHVPIPASSLSKKDPLSTMMDSLTLSQFKGLLEHDYATTISDGYLFRPGTNIEKLVEVIKLGYAPDDGDDPPEGDASAPVHNANMGKARGIGGALGCPPGVCECVVQ
eukprot:CAMPEP_0203663112 /NCGR_PEP_ID=MMETSP0090-20130426/827_1 /ASSEMBLY_ACC=CAM_ASM_001088 /TAXON_ID=426623 /ORGANISM="Chaetoceros affinis, Strain CCMP159" /LENGTH=772 /DNA_ID=CAMNT_0050525981 /DNA_START=142 /DNA_END=2460 /DNA_ORIENTATION=-